MEKNFALVVGLVTTLVLAACAAQSEPTSMPTGAPIIIETPSAPPIPTAAPVATLVTRTQWPPDVKTFVPQGAQIVDSAEADSDGDGISEMVVIYKEQGVGRGLVIRREGENGKAYMLGGDKPPELFRESWTANTIRDINKDGKIEIMVEGVIQQMATSLNIFQWNGKAYETLLSLSGGEGIAIDDAENKGVYDFTALQLLFPRSAIIHTTHAEWKKTAYEVTSDVLFLLGPPTTFNYPEEAALAYYIYLNKDEPEKMFALLTEPQRSKTPLQTLVELSRNVENVRVESLKIDEEKADSATVTLNVISVDRASQKEQPSQPVWRLKKEGKQWRLAELK